MLGFQYLLLFVILVFRVLFFVSDWFLSKIVVFIAKHFYIASILLDFGLIVIIKCIRIYGLNHFWFYFFVGSLGLGFLINVSVWFYFFLYEKLSNFSEWLSEKLFDFKLWLKYKIFKRIEWKLILLKNKVKCKVKHLFRGDK